MRKITELEGLLKEEMTEEELNFRDAVIDRIISLVLHRWSNKNKENLDYSKTDMLLIYQENIMALCQEGAGFSLSRADDVRRALGKKKMSLMTSFKEEFLLGWKNNVGVFGLEIWDKMVDYAKYCFNKSHAVSYTLITAKTAELNRNNKLDFMLYNYKFGKAEKKALAINQLIEVSNLQFPSWNNPFDGMKIQGKGEVIEIKSLKENIDEKISNKIYNSPIELFLEEIPPTIKLKLITRGTYDGFCYDIKGLALLNKKLGKKNTIGYEIPEEYFGSKNLRGMLDALKMKGLLDFYEDDVHFEVCVFNRNVKKMSHENSFGIMKGNRLGEWPSELTIYRNKQIKKNFGIIKKSSLSVYNDRIGEVREVVNKINGVLEKVKSNNPDLKINQKTFDTRIINKVPKIKMLFDNVIDKINSEVLTAYIFDKKIFKNGNCCFTFNFSTNYDNIKFYPKNQEIINLLEKNATVNFRLQVKTYIGRDQTLKFYTDITV